MYDCAFITAYDECAERDGSPGIDVRVIVLDRLRLDVIPHHQQPAWQSWTATEPQLAVRCGFRKIDAIYVYGIDLNEPREPRSLRKKREHDKKAARIRSVVQNETGFVLRDLTERLKLPVFMSNRNAVRMRKTRATVQLCLQSWSDSADFRALLSRDVLYTAQVLSENGLFPSAKLAKSYEKASRKRLADEISLAERTFASVGLRLPAEVDGSNGPSPAVLHLLRKTGKNTFDVDLFVLDGTVPIVSGLEIRRVVQWPKDRKFCDVEKSIKGVTELSNGTFQVDTLVGVVR